MFAASLVVAFSVAFIIVCVSTSGAASASTVDARRQQKPAANEKSKEENDARTLYRIVLSLDFNGRGYQGTERVRWTNRDDRPASVLYFHLYPNMRAEDERAGAQALDAHAPPLTPDEPRLEVTEARAAGQALALVPEDDGATLRVQLREALAPGASVEVELSFKGSVPEIDPDETSLPAHVVQQVGAAMRDTREVRRARDMNFVSRGVMLLGSFYPVLAVRGDDGDWQRRVEATVGDTFFADTADYQVSLYASADVAVFTSGEEHPVADLGHNAHMFEGESRAASR